MRGRRLLTLISLLVCFVLYPALALTYSGGPLPERTGAPTPAGFELTCAASGCHAGNPLNAPGGHLTIEVPAAYTAGDTLDIRIQVARSGQKTYGFELTVKDAAHQPVGTLIHLDTKTRYPHTQGQTYYDYVTHSRPNSAGTWTVRWKAPDAEVGDVVVYAAANAANEDFNNTGDFIYTASRSIRPASAVPVEPLPEPHRSFVGAAYPNPFRDRTNLSFSLAEAAPVTLAVYDAMGRIVKQVDLGVRAPGDHVEPLEAEGWPAGLYVYEVRTPSWRKARPFMVVK